jgi:hypothetical protein
MKVKNLTLIIVSVITLCIIFNGPNIEFWITNSIAGNNENFEQIEPVVLGEQTNPTLKEIIIDLNPSTDHRHQNITIYGANSYNQIGSAIAAGDINGDNINEIIIGSTVSNLVYVIFGNTTPAPYIFLESPPGSTITGADTQDWLGYALAIGDVNGDKMDDLLMTASAADGDGNARTNCGEVYIIYGNATFPSTWNLRNTPADVTIYGADRGDSFGYSIATGDINNDGFDDILGGAVYADGVNNAKGACGEVHVIYGNGTLPSKIDLATSPANVTIFGVDGNDNAGAAVAAGDVNSDDRDDIIIGAYYADGETNSVTSCGEVYIIYSNDSLPAKIDLANSSQNQNVTIFGDDRYDNLGTRLTIGDLNDDNIDDLVMSAIAADGPANARSNCGEVYVLYGNETFKSNISASETNVSMYGEDSGDVLGFSIATGDANHDGIDDLITGAYYADGSENLRQGCGEAYVFYCNGSLLSTIDLASQAPDITIWGGDGWGGGTYSDWAGYSVFIADVNGDNKGDIFLSATAGDGRNNGKRYSGEVYGILSGGKLLPMPLIESISFENGGEDDEKTCFAKYFHYQFRVRVIASNGLEDVDTVTLSLAYDVADQNFQFQWSKATQEFIEILDANNYAELSDRSKIYDAGNNILNFEFMVIFNWSYPDESLHGMEAYVLGITGLGDLVSRPTNVFRVKTKLNFKGTIAVIDDDQKVLPEGSWIHAGEPLTWGGLRVIYNGTEDIYPPEDANVTVTVSDPFGNNWTEPTKAKTKISIETYAIYETKHNVKYSVKITGVPEVCDVSNVTFKLNIDADNVTFSKPIPDNKTWQATLAPRCRISLMDPTTGVNASTVQYRISTDNGSIWSTWVHEGIIPILDNKYINCSVKPILKDGKNNIIQWRARDIVGNNYTESEKYPVLVDVSRATFVNPKPASEVWQNSLTVECGITIIDNLSGVNASSIEFSISTIGIWGYGSWQSARQKVDGNIISCSVESLFSEGNQNYIRWRAKDVVGNEYNISDNYQIKLKLNHPPESILHSPENFSIIYTLTPELTWSSFDPDNDENIFYDIYLSSDREHVLTLNESALIKANHTDTRYEIEMPLNDRVTYYWTVVPHDKISSGVCTSGVWEFLLNRFMEIPIVTLSEPKNNIKLTTTTPELSWEVEYLTMESVAFDIFLSKSQFQTDSIPEEYLLLEDYELTTLEIESPLKEGDTYYWTVIPIVYLNQGKIRGECRSNVWNFNIASPEEKIYRLGLMVEDQILTTIQGNYTQTNVSITNMGNSADTIEVSIDKGILDANVGLEHLGSLIWLNKSDVIRLKLEILVSKDAKPQNYTISITATSTGGLAEGKDIANASITRTILLVVLEKEKEPEEIDEKGEKKESGIDYMIWSFLIILLILILIMFLYVHRSRRIPYVKSELLTKPPDHLKLPGVGVKVGAEGELLVPMGEEGVINLEGKTIPITYQLPRAVLSKEQRLDLLDERFLLGEVSEETYKELKTKLASSKDITEVEEPKGEKEIVGEIENELKKEPKEDQVPDDVGKPSSEEGEEVESEPVPEDVEDIVKIEDKETEKLVKELEEGDSEPELESRIKEREIAQTFPDKKKQKRPRLKKKKKTKRPKLLKKEAEGPFEEPIDEDELEDILKEMHPFPGDGLCISCGESLDPDMAFCWSCGAKYEKNKKN